MGYRWRSQIVVLALVGLLASGCTWITRASVDTTGGDPDSNSFEPSMSSDGRYVAFYSFASDLVAGDGNGVEDVFVRDLRTNTTTRASVDTTGGDPNGGSSAPSISGDGRYVAFGSIASDLVAGDGNGVGDVFVRDRQANTTTRVSVDTTGGDPDSDSGTAPESISADGRYVAFGSSASDLVAGDGNGFIDVFVRDLRANTTTRVSVDTAGGDPDSNSVRPSMSGDGRYVAFFSFASDLVAGDGNGVEDVFVRDRQANTTTRASVDFLGQEANFGSSTPSISGDGRYLAFFSLASDLVLRDGNGFFDVFVRAVVTPTVDSVTPNSLARGTTATLRVTGSGFFPGAQATAEAFTENGGVTVNSVTVLSETELEVSVSVAADAVTGTRHLAVWNPGTGPGVLATGFGGCQNCLTVT
jgi:Tol biopolymer transport system component